MEKIETIKIIKDLNFFILELIDYQLEFSRNITQGYEKSNNIIIETDEQASLYELGYTHGMKHIINDLQDYYKKLRKNETIKETK